MALEASMEETIEEGIRMEELIIKKLLGEGSFGKVTLVAHELDPDTHYAMKVIDKTSSAESERRVLSYVCNPFIVGLRHWFETETQVCLLLDYCPAGTLHKHLRRCGGRFPEETTRFYVSEVVLALEYLHSSLVIYRDLKTENILLDAEGHLKITDFGLVAEGVSDNVSASGMCGTLEYCAPEMVDERGHGRALDWWTAGILTWQLMTGRTPFETRKGSHEVLFRRIKTMELRPPQGLSELGKSFILALLDRDPSTRLGSGEADGVDVRAHEWFGDQDWTAIWHLKAVPPFVPELDGPEDLRYLYSHLERAKELSAQPSCLSLCVEGLLKLLSCRCLLGAPSEADTLRQIGVGQVREMATPAANTRRAYKKEAKA